MSELFKAGQRVATNDDGNGVIIRESSAAVRGFGFKWLVRLDREAEELNFMESQLRPLSVAPEHRPVCVGALKAGSR
jgi:hypothetical protein